MKKKSTSGSDRTQKARLAISKKDFPAAKKNLQLICAQTPHDIKAWLLLCDVYGAEKNYDEVINCCKRVFELEPNNAVATTYMGRAYSYMGRNEEALQTLQRALQLSPGNLVIGLDLGKALLQAGKLNEAAGMLIQIVRQMPDNAEAHFSFAEALAATGDTIRAIDYFQKAVQLHPHWLAAHIRLNSLLLERHGDGFEAEKSIIKSLQVLPNAAQLYYGLAVALTYQGRYDDALASVARGLEISPDDPRGLLSEANIYERQGDLEESYKRIRLLIERGFAQGNELALSLFLRLCRNYDCCDEAVELANRYLAIHGNSARMSMSLHQALADFYDKLGSYDDAFAHFEKLNVLTNVAFDREKYATEMKKIIDKFTPEMMKKAPRAVNSSERPVFIIGMPRSGTTLVEQILASHPEVYGGGEITELNIMIQSMPPGFFPKYIDTIQQETLDELAENYLDKLATLNPDAKRVTDKMPGNFIHLGLIALLFPQSRVIHCMRNPLDTCLSIFFQHFGASHPYASNLSNIGFFYKEYLRMMEHWKKVVSLSMLEIQYEELVADQEKFSKEIIAFCGLDWDDRIMQFHETERDVATASYGQVRQPIYTSSVARWKKYEKYLGPLKEALGIAEVN